MKLEINGSQYIIHPRDTEEIIEGIKIDGKALIRVRRLRASGETKDWMDENDDFHGTKWQGVGAVKIGDVLKHKEDISVYAVGTIDGEPVFDYTDMKATVVLEDTDIQMEKQIAEKERQQLMQERAKLMQKLAKINKRLGL